MRARSRGDTSSPSPIWLTSKFWQNTQRRLHQEKKMVPEPRQPRSTSSSPKWGKKEATRA